MEIIFIRGIEFPPTVKGVTTIDSDGNYNIYINLLLSDEAKKKTLDHELIHIKKCHFENYDPVIVNELEANAG